MQKYFAQVFFMTIALYRRSGKGKTIWKDFLCNKNIRNCTQTVIDIDRTLKMASLSQCSNILTTIKGSLFELFGLSVRKYLRQEVTRLRFKKYKAIDDDS